MTRIAVFAAALLGFATPALALPGLLGEAAGSEACYTRVYSADHLARNPAQRVTVMRVSFRRETYPGSVGVDPQAFIRLEVMRRGEGQVMRAIGGCDFRADANIDTSNRRLIRNYPRRSGILCNITGEGLDSEGGVLMVEPAQGTLKLYVDDSITMRTKRKVSAEPGRNIRFGGADGVFHLNSAGPDACADLKAGISAE